MADNFVLPSLQDQKTVQPALTKGAEPFILPSASEEPPSLSEDIGKSIVSGAAKSGPALVGMAGNIAQLPDLAERGLSWSAIKAAEQFGLLPQGKTAEDFFQATQKLGQEVAPQPEAVQKGEVTLIGGKVPLPTSHGMVELAKRMGLPTYQSKTPIGEVTQNVVEQIPQTLVAPGTTAEKLMTGIPALIGSETAGELLKGTDYETAARLVGGIIPAVGGKSVSDVLAARKPEAVTPRAMDIAGQAMREAVPEPATTASTLRTGAGPTIPDVAPTTAQVAREPGITGLQSKLDTIAKKESAPELASRAGKEQLSEQAVNAAGSDLAARTAAEIPPPVDVKGSFGLQGQNPAVDASSAVKSIATVLEEQKARIEKDAWTNPSLSTTTVKTEPLVNALTNYVNRLEPVARQAFPAELKNLIATIANEGDTVALQTPQNLRSLALNQASKAWNSPTPMRAGDVYGFADVIRQFMNEPKNIAFGGPQAIAAWNDARAATKSYHDIFDKDFMSKLVGSTKAGGEKIAPEAALDRMLSGGNGAQNLREVRGVLGPQVDQHVSDYIISKLTGNGSDLQITPAKVSKFMADPKNAAIINEVPNLNTRIQNIAQQVGESAQQAEMRVFHQELERITGANNPRSLANFLDRNQSMISKIYPKPEDQAYINALRNSAKVIQKIPAGAPVGTKTLDQLANNNLFTIMYGRATGALSDTAMGALAGHILSRVTGTLVGVAEPVTGILSALGVGSKIAEPIRKSMNNVFFGNTQETAMSMLHRAMEDPAFAAMLMERPTPQSIGILSKAMENIATGTRATVVNEQSRSQRKAGGRVMRDAISLAQDAVRTRKAIGGQTEQMLSMPDDAIVSALHTAKKTLGGSI
jgi:hypothetical protein